MSSYFARRLRNFIQPFRALETITIVAALTILRMLQLECRYHWRDYGWNWRLHIHTIRKRVGTHDKNIRVYQQSMTSRLTDVLNFNAAIGITINVYVTKQNKIIELPLINDFVVTPDRERMRERQRYTSIQFLKSASWRSFSCMCRNNSKNK